MSNLAKAPTVFHLLSRLKREWPHFQHVYSKARPKDEHGRCLPLSNSELRNMIQANAVELNGRRDWKPDEEAPSMVHSLVLWPKGKHRTTLMQSEDFKSVHGITHFIQVEGET